MKLGFNYRGAAYFYAKIKRYVELNKIRGKFMDNFWKFAFHNNSKMFNSKSQAKPRTTPNS